MKFPSLALAAILAAPPAAVHTTEYLQGQFTLGARSLPEATQVRSISVLPSKGHADVVVNVDPTIDLQDFILDSPHRIVLDLKGATLSSPAPSYDRVARGGIVNVRASQYRANIVRVVIELDKSYTYTIKRGTNEVHILVNGASGTFAAWHSSDASATSTSVASTSSSSNSSSADASDNAADNSSPDVASTAVAAAAVTHTHDDFPADATATAHSTSSLSQQPRAARITVTYDNADIHDVIAAFATFAGRTIVVGKDVSGTVTAEIRDQPWDVALRAILQGQGLAEIEDQSSGIISVDSYANIQAKQALEPLVTQLISINYAKADSLVPVVTKLLIKDCSSAAGAPTDQTSTGAGGGSGANCITRGAVAANPATNTLIVTETPSRIDDIIRYVHNLDVRTPQVAIKAKIIFVDRTNIEDLGLSYDLGTKTQFFNQLVPRTDPSTLKPIDTNGDGVPDALGGGTPYSGNQISIGGSALSAIANANDRVVSPALSLIYSAAIGKFSLTSFLDALQQINLADLQAEPSIVTVDNREAQIQVGQDIPVRVLDASTANVGNASGNSVPRATVSFKPVGIILQVTPHITNNHQILLDVHAENSNAQIASSDIGYVFNKQSADNRLLVRDGETAVIGGLTVTDITESKSGIPILVDLPGIGRLFGTTNRSEEKRDLLILITPHVIDDGSLPPPPAPTRTSTPSTKRGH